ncbi:restriction endonuclease subunit S [Aeromonas veronii]|uniref:restriction endonuclease subunit S n=1 Tax=Aeromonas TaxID=642 RepID=UPI0030051D06
MTNKYKPYAETLDSGVDWIGHIPTSWKIVPLKAIADIDNGGCYGAEPEDGAYLYPVATTAQIDSSGHFWVDNMSIRSFTTSEVVRYLCREGDILVVKSSGSSTNIISGKAGIVTSTTPKFIFSNFLMRVSPKQNLVDSKFVYALLISHLTKERIKQMVSTTTYPNLQVGEYCSAKLPLPPLPEQQAIAAFLDYETARIDKLIAKQQQLIELLKEKRQAVISHAVTKGLNPNAPMKDSGVEWLGEVPEHWVVLQLRHIIIKIEQGKSPECENRQIENNEWGVLKTGCVNGGVFNEKEHKALPSYMTPHADFEIRANDILMSRASGSRHLIGAVAYVHSTQSRLLLSDKVFRLILTKNIDSEYFVYLMGTKNIRDQVEQAINGAEGLANNITKESIKSFISTFPPHEEQIQVRLFLDNELLKLSKTEKKLEFAKNLLQERRTALISAAVTGKIDLRGWKPPQNEVAA